MLVLNQGNWNTFIPLVLFAVLAGIEIIRPRRTLTLGRRSRWITHGVFFLSNSVIGRLLAFVMVVASAVSWSEQHAFGLLYVANWPWWVEAAIAFVVLDFAMWFQHFAMHKIPLLWRAHQVHHSDPDMDVSTALRFHPFELIVSSLYKSAWMAMLGVPMGVAVAFELWLNANALFNHSNIRLRQWMDAAIRPFLVTPDMHLVHHSTLMDEQHKNYGFALTIWDRLARTYKYESDLGRSGQKIGLEDVQDNRPAGVYWSLTLPLHTRR